MSVDAPKHVVIIGGGFGGLTAAKILGKYSKLQITLIDRRNHHLFQPLLYQVAMAGLSPAEIAMPIRAILSRFRNTEVLLGEVSSVDMTKKEVHTNLGKHSYDYLILACGTKHSYFGNEQWEPLAPGLKTLEQATEIRRRVLMAFELAEGESNKEKQKSALTFVVVGGGPTGVELAGAIGEISRYTLTKDFRNIDSNRTRIVLIEAGPRILASFSEKTSQSATRSLEKLGVQVWTDSRVSEISPHGVRVGDEFLQANTVLWAAGVKPSSLNKTLGVPLDKQGRIIVQKDLSIANHPEVFAVGDQAFFGEDGQRGLPGLAPVAIQQGRQAAKNIVRLWRQQPTQAFHYIDKGQLATIGRRIAVLEIGGLRMHGFTAWLVWLLVHIYYLIGFKNRLFVFFQWAWHYFSYSRGARLILNKEWRFYTAPKSEKETQS